MDFFRIKLASVEIIHDGDCLNSGHADQASAQSAGIDFLGSSTVRVHAKMRFGLAKSGLSVESQTNLRTSLLRSARRQASRGAKHPNCRTPT